MEKLLRYLLLSCFLFFAVLASAQSKGKQKEKNEKYGQKPKDKKSDKHGKKVKNKKTGIGERPPNKDQIAKHKKENGEKKRKKHEKKLRANKEYVKANKQRRKEKSDEDQ
jgi:hypothetical protein